MAKAPIGGSGKGPDRGKKAGKGYGNPVVRSGKLSGPRPPRKTQGKG